MRRALVLLALAACARRSDPPPVKVSSPPSAAAARSASPPAEPEVVADAAPAAPAQIDADGDDDPIDTRGTLPASPRFERVGRAPLALQHVCDLTPLGDALYAAHANMPLGTDGATITRYRPDDPKTPYTIAFDWNRPGEPTTGGGAGQGFLRVHLSGGRLVVPDADPPYAGFGLVEPATEGYVFVSDAEGRFDPVRAPGHRPPKSTGVVPRAYHVIDTIRFRGRFYTSTGSTPPKSRAWSGPAPGALHVANEDLSRWIYEVDYPFPYKNGVWRLTYMTRFRDRLYVGIQDFDGRDPNDYLVFAPPAEATTLTREHVRPGRVTPNGGAQTLRWYADRGRLFWIAHARGDGVRLRVTSDGDTWSEIALPDDAGRPTDVTRFGDAIYVLAERGLYRLDGDVPTLAVAVTEKKSPFVLNDGMCAAPLGVLRGVLYAGGQTDGALYRVAGE